jgi:hypothetical protein
VGACCAARNDFGGLRQRAANKSTPRHTVHIFTPNQILQTPSSKLTGYTEVAHHPMRLLRRREVFELKKAASTAPSSRSPVVWQS